MVDIEGKEAGRTSTDFFASSHYNDALHGADSQFECSLSRLDLSVTKSVWRITSTLSSSLGLSTRNRPAKWYRQRVCTEVCAKASRSGINA
jgi:hypothetical protein